MNGAFISGIGDYVTVFEPSGIQLEKKAPYSKLVITEYSKK